jgi:hypothetical protein
MPMNPDKDTLDDDGWEYGDEWKQGRPDQPVPDEDIQYLAILRGDTGMGYDDSSLLDLVAYLGSRGIRATYESFTVGMEPAAIKTYVLKAESGKEDEAVRLLEEKFKAEQ